MSFPLVPTKVALSCQGAQQSWSRPNRHAAASIPWPIFAWQGRSFAGPGRTPVFFDVYLKVN